MSVDTQKSTRETFRAIWAALTDGLPAVITSHVRLDGDGVGCALALRLALIEKGVEATVALDPPVPTMFGFLPGMDEVRSGPDGLPERYNLVVIDCGSLERTGEMAPGLGGRARTINIDHHGSNAVFGDLNYVVPDASSCGEILFGVLAAGGVPLSLPIAECLLTAVVSDTGQFSHQDTTPAAYEVAGKCVEAGARPHVVVEEPLLPAHAGPGAPAGHGDGHAELPLRPAGQHDGGDRRDVPRHRPGAHRYGGIRRDRHRHPGPGGGGAVERDARLRLH